MKYYRKQPVEAIQWTGDNQMEVSEFIQKVTKSFATKDDGFGNLNVCYMDSKKHKHQVAIPKFGWIVVEGKTLQFYKDDTFRKTFKPVAESASEALWRNMEELEDQIMKETFAPEFVSDDEYFHSHSYLDKCERDCYERLRKLSDGKLGEAFEDLIKRTMQLFHISRNEAVDKLCDGLEESLLGGKVSDKDAGKVTFASVLDEMKELHSKKNKDYGGSFHDLFKEYEMPYALGHLEEKLNRVKAITHHGGNAVKNEHVEDSVIDLACYAVMLYVELKNKEK